MRLPALEFSLAMCAAALAPIAAGCSTPDKDAPNGAFGKADGFGPDTRGPGCKTSDIATYGYLVAKLQDNVGVQMAADGSGFELIGPMSEATRGGLDGALDQLLETLGGFDRSVDDVRPMFRDAPSSFASAAPVARRTADLGTYYQVRVDDLDRDQVESLCQELGTSPLVELAYPQPRPELALAKEGVNLVTDERFVDVYTDYLAPAADGGFGAAPVRALPGARGEGVRIVDLEFGAALGHEDFPAIELVAGDPEAFDDHGTAVLGIIGAQGNEFGSEGLAPLATLGSSAWTPDGDVDFAPSIAELILRSAEWAGPGGILLIEMHAPAVTSIADCSASCNPFQCNFVPMEYFPAIFDAIRAATDAGVHVVEAAGNGGVDLDQALADRRTRDSGAILVGASLSTARAPACFTNHGESVDVFGWGENVVTTGYGDHPVHDEIPVTSNEDSYTHVFAGTSSASPLVVGSAASVLGLAKAQLGEELHPVDLRDLLSRSGARQTSTSPPDHPERFFLIGSQPDIERAWSDFQQLIPVAAFTETQPEPLVVELANNSLARSATPEAEIVAVQWDFGDGNSSTSFAPTHRYLAAGDYRVTLSVIARSGHTRTVSRTVTVAADETSMSRDAEVLDLVNSASLSVLDDEVRLRSDAAKNIVELRPFETIGELLAVPRVGPASLEQLYEFVSR